MCYGLLGVQDSNEAWKGASIVMRVFIEWGADFEDSGIYQQGVKACTDSTTLLVVCIDITYVKMIRKDSHNRSYCRSIDQSDVALAM